MWGGGGVEGTLQDHGWTGISFIGCAALNTPLACAEKTAKKLQKQRQPPPQKNTERCSTGVCRPCGCVQRINARVVAHVQCKLTHCTVPLGGARAPVPLLIIKSLGLMDKLRDRMTLLHRALPLALTFWGARWAQLGPTNVSGVHFSCGTSRMQPISKFVRPPPQGHLHRRSLHNIPLRHFTGAWLCSLSGPPGGVGLCSIRRFNLPGGEDPLTTRIDVLKTF